MRRPARTKPYATGLRNPTALAIQPGTGQLWAVVNERDEIRPEPRPGLSDRRSEGGFYGWPYSYWGQNVDTRAQPQDPQKVASAIRPDYALGSHVAALGVAFSTPAMGGEVRRRRVRRRAWQLESRTRGLQGRVRAVPRRQPAGDPVDFVSGFLDGRQYPWPPVGVTVDPRGALIVCDDLANTVWRITPNSVQQSVASTQGPQ